MTKDRLTGYESALKQYQLPIDSNLTYFANEFLEEKGYQFSKRLFKHDPMIDAIITTDSLLAEGVCDYITKHQLDVPVLSFDSVNPKLNLAAYVDINSLELGRTSFETILQIINDAKSNKQICYRQLIAHKIIEKIKPARAGFLVTNFLFQRIVPEYEHSPIQRQRHLDPPVS